MWSNDEEELACLIPHASAGYESFTVNCIIHFSVRLIMRNKAAGSCFLGYTQMIEKSSLFYNRKEGEFASSFWIKLQKIIYLEDRKKPIN